MAVTHSPRTRPARARGPSAERRPQPPPSRRVHLQSFGRQVLESLPSGILVIDVTSRVLYINREGARIVEVRPAQFTGSMLIGQPRFRPLLSSINQYRRRTPSLSTSRQQFEGAIVRTDGRVVPLGFSISNLVNSRRRVLGYVLIFRDLTDVERLRQRTRNSEMMAALGTMAAGVAHEIRNPLHTIRAALDVLEVKLARNEDPGEYLDVVRGEIERADRTVKEILTYSKQSDAHYGRSDVTACLERAVRRAKVPRTVSVERRFEDGLPEVYFDDGRLMRVFINLLENAVQAMDGKGTILLRVRSDEVRKVASDGVAAASEVLVEIEDTGPGIAPADLPHVFEPFFTRKGSYGGTGLGLAICQRIVAEHEGRIEAKSPPGLGAVFTVRLPVKETIG